MPVRRRDHAEADVTSSLQLGGENTKVLSLSSGPAAGCHTPRARGHALGENNPTSCECTIGRAIECFTPGSSQGTPESTRLADPQALTKEDTGAWKSSTMPRVAQPAVSPWPAAEAEVLLAEFMCQRLEPTQS